MGGKQFIPLIITITSYRQYAYSLFYPILSIFASSLFVSLDPAWQYNVILFQPLKFFQKEDHSIAAKKVKPQWMPYHRHKSSHTRIINNNNRIMIGSCKMGPRNRIRGFPGTGIWRKFLQTTVEKSGDIAARGISKQSGKHVRKSLIM